MSRCNLGRRVLPLALSLVLFLSFAPLTSGCGQKDKDTAAAGDTADEAAEGKNKPGSGQSASTSATKAKKDSSSSADTSSTKKKVRKEKPVSVNVCNAFRGELVVPVVAEGTIRARRTAELRFELSGKIRRIAVKEGQSVKKGQLLAQLDDREYRIRIEEAHSRYLQALGKVAVEEDGSSLPQDSERAKVLRKKLQDLADMEARGEITRTERLDREIALGMEAVGEGGFRRELVEARSGLAQARADEEQARLNLEKTQLRAPFAGVVTGLTLAPGEWVNANQAFASLVDNVDIEAVVGVLESDLKNLELQRPALLAVPALGDTIPVRVDVISPRIDSASRTCQVLMRLRSEDGRVKPGMFVRALIAGEILKDRLLVPREAILTRDGRPLLFKVVDGRSKWVYVKLGAQNDRFVEIEKVLQGGPLEPGVPVIISNHLTLAHDAKIKIKKTVTPPDAWASFERTQ